MTLKSRISPSTEKGTVPSLVAELLHSATVAHLYHFETSSFAQHKAFEDYYETIVGKADTLAEAYLGKYGRTKFPSPKLMMTADPLIYFAELCKLSESTTCCPNIDNIIQEVTTEIDVLTYKLTLLS
jgi:DNA-binding ferritin-like protein